MAFFRPFFSPSIPTLLTMLSPSDVSRINDFWFHPSPSPTAEDLSARWFLSKSAFDETIRMQFGPLITAASAAAAAAATATTPGTDNATTTTSSSLEDWTTASPASVLALIILLDQFPRNVHRGSGLAHATDAQALRIAVAAVARGYDRALTPLQQLFVYLPFEHDEDLCSQVAGVSLYEGLVARFEEQLAAKGGESRATEVETAAKEDHGFGGGRKGATDDGDEGGIDGAATLALLQSSLNYAERHRDVILKFGRFPSRNAVLGRKSTAEEEKFLEEHPHGF